MLHKTSDVRYQEWMERLEICALGSYVLFILYNPLLKPTCKDLVTASGGLYELFGMRSYLRGELVLTSTSN